MQDWFFFGYGSLVNRDTHDYPESRPARLRGWRRRWRHTKLRDLAYLSAERCKGAEIDGLIAMVPGGDWAALDARERAYDRVVLAEDEIRHDHPAARRVRIYRTRAGQDAPPSMRHPILLSYIDTVAAGYHALFGAEGARAFFATTEGWDAPVRDDRAAPVYPRAVAPGAALRRLVDTALDQREVRRFR